MTEVLLCEFDIFSRKTEIWEDLSIEVLKVVLIYFGINSFFFFQILDGSFKFNCIRRSSRL